MWNLTRSMSFGTAFLIARKTSAQKSTIEGFAGFFAAGLPPLWACKFTAPTCPRVGFPIRRKWFITPSKAALFFRYPSECFCLFCVGIVHLHCLQFQLLDEL